MPHLVVYWSLVCFGLMLRERRERLAIPPPATLHVAALRTAQTRRKRGVVPVTTRAGADDSCQYVALEGYRGDMRQDRVNHPLPFRRRASSCATRIGGLLRGHCALEYVREMPPSGQRHANAMSERAN